MGEAKRNAAKRAAEFAAVNAEARGMSDLILNTRNVVLCDTLIMRVEETPGVDSTGAMESAYLAATFLNHAMEGLDAAGKVQMLRGVIALAERMALEQAKHEKAVGAAH